MCQPVSGPETYFSKPRLAWKIVDKWDYKRGPLYETRFLPGMGGWSVRINPKARVDYTPGYVTVQPLTSQGYHVLSQYILSDAWYVGPLETIPVWVRGKAIPFRSGRVFFFSGKFGKKSNIIRGEGWAVEQWKPVNPILRYFLLAFNRLDYYLFGGVRCVNQ